MQIFPGSLNKSDDEKHFVIVIPSYNNKDWYEKNVSSVLSQNYTNFEVIYIDDNSPDGTGDLVEDFIRDFNPPCKVTLIKNEQRVGQLANRYKAVRMCDNTSIIVMVDGDDWLAHDDVLAYLNEVYSDPNVWLTYGQYKRYPTDQIGWGREIPEKVLANNTYREYGWVSSHLRTFYAWLFKQVKRESLLYQGKFLTMATDMATMIPMIEMAAERTQFIPDVLYVYNIDNPNNLHKIDLEFQEYLDRFIRSKPKYTRLEKPIIKIHEKKIVVVIPSFNNESCYKDNLDGVFSQKYQNYRVIYIDDCSTDNTGTLVEQYIADNNLQEKMCLIRNNYNRKALANIYKAVFMCDDDDIILVLDGDDWFAHDQVLVKINEAFSTENIWLTYAQYKNVPEEIAKQFNIPVIGYAKETPLSVIEDKTYRLSPNWAWSGLRAFYAWLFKCIKLESLFFTKQPYLGKFFPTSYDAAMLYPMLEMAGPRIKFISEILLHRNVDTPLNDFKINHDLQKEIGKILRAQEEYPTLQSKNDRLTCFTQESNQGTSLIVSFAKRNRFSLPYFLKKCCKCLKGLGNIYVLHSSSNKDNNLQTDSVFYNYSNKNNLTTKDNLPNVFLIDEQDTNFRQQLLSHLENNKNNHILLTHTNKLIDKPINLNSCIATLEETFAYGFYLNVDLNTFEKKGSPVHALPCEHIVDDIYAWKFNCFNPAGWQDINNFDLTLYRKNDFIKALKNMKANTIEQLESEWDKVSLNSQKAGLFFAGSV